MYKYSSWRYRFGKSWKDWKYKNLNILRTEHIFSMKQKKFLTCASGGTFWEIICSGADL